MLLGLNSLECYGLVDDKILVEQASVTHQIMLTAPDIATP